MSVHRGHAWQGGVHGKEGHAWWGGHAWQGGTHDRGVCMVVGDMHDRGTCMAGDMHDRGVCMVVGVCMAGGMCGRECAWQGASVAGGMHGRGHTWQGGGGMHGGGHAWQGGHACHIHSARYGRSMYASYWNAFLLVIFLAQPTDIDCETMQSTIVCLTRRAKTILETSLPRQESHDTLASGMAAQNWCLGLCSAVTWCSSAELSLCEIYVLMATLTRSPGTTGHKNTHKPTKSNTTQERSKIDQVCEIST